MKLLGTEKAGDRIDRYYLHTGDDGKDRITVDTSQEVDPLFKRAKRLSETDTKDFRFLATIPFTMIDDICRIKAPDWGMRPGDVYKELIAKKTDRSKVIWKMLCEGSDFRKLQKGY